MIPRFTVCSSAVVSNMEEGERKIVQPDSKETSTATCSSTLSVSKHEPETDSKAGGDDADKIDVCSDKFDPFLALYSPTVSLPFPNVKCFNNVSEYESFLKGGRGRAKPENVEKRRRKAMKGVADPERIERLKKLMVNNPVAESEAGESSSTTRSRRQKPQKNVLTRMPLCQGSPLGELYRCVQERIRVKVHIRTFKGLRGVCSGFVVAFDKFWNMAMVDVDETYREPLLGEALYHEKALTISRVGNMDLAWECRTPAVHCLVDGKLFAKLKVQQSSAGDEPTKKREAHETASKHQPAHDPRKRGHSGTESKLSDSVKTKQEEHKVLLKAQGPAVCQKKESRTYGKVHTRHINQLFIRGENVILVNPQPL